MSDLALHEQIALFAMNNPEPPASFNGGQYEWAAFLIYHAEKFCEIHKDTDWSSTDWYETSDAYIDPIIEAMCEVKL